MEQVKIYCDGSCLGNPGPGGWGAIIRENGRELELSGGKELTTNNEMELTAAIESLRALKKPSRVTLTTDSQYLVKGMTEWIAGWLRNGWKTSGKKPVKNKELWEELRKHALQHNVEWKWIRGHAGHPENERCDGLAVNAANRMK